MQTMKVGKSSSDKDLKERPDYRSRNRNLSFTTMNTARLDWRELVSR